MAARSLTSYENSIFLGFGDEDEEIVWRRKAERRVRLGQSQKAFIIHFTFTAVYVTLTMLFFLGRPSSKVQWPTADIKSLKDAVELRTQFLQVDIGHGSPYTGLPSYEIDLAWHHLFDNSNLRISPEEMEVNDMGNRTTIRLTDDNFYASLDVHHQLHCLKFLRWYIYPEYYDFRLNATSTLHADHCIENLRRNIMCLPSLEILTYDWKPNKVDPQPHFSYNHKCVDWEKIYAWTKERSFDYFDKTLLVNPILDPALVDENDREE